MVIVYYKGSVLVTETPTHEHMKFIWGMQGLSIEKAEAEKALHNKKEN